MGILSDTVEDNAESEGWRIESIRQKLGIPSSTPRSFPSVICPLCQQFFFSNTDLQNHIFNEHRDYYGNIPINGVILTNDEIFTNEDIEKLNFSDLDDIAFDLQTRIDRGNSINSWADYKTPLNRSNEHPLRKQYLKGMLEYLRAHYQEINESSSNYQSLSEQFGRAFGYLEPFPSLVAQQTRYSISFKMNWFSQMAEASEYSLFFWAGQFFINDYERVAAITLPPSSSRQTQGIIIDYFHEEFLEALRLYYCDRSTLKYGWLVKLERLLNNMSNRNYKDKLALLKARLFREWGEVNQAKEAYRSIKTHPIFKAEATGF
ncbi:hypothetical protein [Nostoc sp. FACHB-133]|uniref:hypothetical protein n=1 Tax=Nostoc sp. FACHB-133 TaxID=2692835 RepID=UPI001F54CF38|nr:hypothetical protein [Nostoc sp. FACHB-133]